jgi:hypothetical protein
MLQGMSAAAAALYSPRRVTRRSYGFPTWSYPGFIRPSPILCPSDKPSARYTDKGDTKMRNSLKALMKKKTLFAFVLAITIFGAVYGFAATLNLSTNQLSAGNATVASCQATTPVASYAVAYDSTLGGYKVGTVTVTSLDAACATKAVSVTLTGAAGANLNTITGVVPAGGGIVALTPGATVSAALVTGLSVAVNG